MQNNYQLMESFLELIRNFAISNPNVEIDYHFIYSQLISFNLKHNQIPHENVREYFPNWEKRYSNNPNLQHRPDGPEYFIWFQNGQLSGNEIKLYLPLDKEHLEEGVNRILDFIANNQIVNQSKVAQVIRNDNFVVRVINMEDANAIINFVNNDPYIMEGLSNVNPFLPNFNGVGMAMDNQYSFNTELCKAIADLLHNLKKYNDLDSFNIENFNGYMNFLSENTIDLELKDIYTLLSKTTSKNYTNQDFINHVENKIVDMYTASRKRITDPKAYLERAIIETEKKYPQNSKHAIFNYMNGDSRGFTRHNHARDGLIKYVKKENIMDLMMDELNINREENINQFSVIDMYVDKLLMPVTVLKEAYNDTLAKYNYDQAHYALTKLMKNNDSSAFTNQNGNRDKLDSVLRSYSIYDIIYKTGVKITSDMDSVIEQIENNILIGEKDNLKVV